MVKITKLNEWECNKTEIANKWTVFFLRTNLNYCVWTTWKSITNLHQQKQKSIFIRCTFEIPKCKLSPNVSIWCNLLFKYVSFLEIYKHIFNWHPSIWTVTHVIVIYRIECEHIKSIPLYCIYNDCKRALLNDIQFD